MLDILSINWNVNPEIFRIGGFAVRWYGLLFVAGFFLGYYLFQKFCKRERVSEKMLDPLLYTLLIGTIVGARLGHCIFYQPDYYFGSWEGFWEIFQPWKGGLASHGESIALVGRGTDDLLKGSHLHFELWYQGQPLDPEKYILFQ